MILSVLMHRENRHARHQAGQRDSSTLLSLSGAVIPDRYGFVHVLETPQRTRRDRSAQNLHSAKNSGQTSER